MPSGAKRRKAARKKKEKTQTAISNGNGEVKVVESDGGENSSPASQEFEPHQNPFSIDEAKEPSGEDESGESEKDPSFSVLNGYGKVVEIAGEANSDNGGRSFDFSPQKESAEVKMNGERDRRVELQKNEDEEKVHPSETFSDLEEVAAERLPSPDTILERRPEEIIGRQLQKSDVRVSHSEQRAGSSVIHQVAEKEPRCRKTKPRGQAAVDCSSYLQAQVDKAVSGDLVSKDRHMLDQDSVDNRKQSMHRSASESNKSEIRSELDSENNIWVLVRLTSE